MNFGSTCIICVLFLEYFQPWEPTTFIFWGYNPYIGGVKPSNFMVLGSKGNYIGISINFGSLFFRLPFCKGQKKHVCQDNTDIDRAERILNEVWGGILGKEMTTLKGSVILERNRISCLLPLRKRTCFFH